jgi:RNA polymerase sigma-70 factor (ECF subfamily)
MSSRAPDVSEPTDQKFPDSEAIRTVHARSEEMPARSSNLTFSELFNGHARYLWRALLGLGVPERDVDDACQDVLLVAHRRLADIEPETLRSWLYGVCVRVASGYRRKVRSRREAPSEELPEHQVQKTPFDDVAAVRLEGALMRALNELDEDKRAAFVLYEIEELTLREVAAALECPLQTAYSRLGAARSHVRKAFAKEGEP